MERVTFKRDDPYYAMLSKRAKNIRLLAKVLKEYQQETSNPIDKFEEEYGCKIIWSECGNISGVSFVNESAESMFYLKYGNR